MTQQAEEQPLNPGALVYDPVAGKVGEYRDKAGPYAMLRPVGGGREWQADPARIRPATMAERLSAEVKAVNDRAGRGAVRGPGYDLTCPPVPVPGCAACAELDGQRKAARAEFDGSKVTDANVLMRQHQRREHGG
ncbi:hypothetical protein [Streptomyces sp. NBC_00878]|uniref:hypothetical protein n=1 Tax=Streptomyces sp. NBC_00878 TaxID=2975854 RepID=UPI00225673A2|nr:hypothetical protein [Streptomyces sp. NBC_00878]MCX4907307.1 hypothetical protein [Streptomyces sp. NBC_00878]